MKLIKQDKPSLHQLFGSHVSSGTFVIFSISILSMLLYNYIKIQSFYYESPDGTLYLSIAQNLVKNGHFIQTARPHEVNMVVPPGAPLLFAVILALTYSHVNIIMFQYALFGLSAVLLSKAAGFFSKTAAVLVPALFVSACIHVGQPNPSALLTENYSMFLMCLSLYLFLHPRMSVRRKVLLLVPVWFYGFLVRPVLGGLLAMSLAAMAVLVIRKEIPVKCLAAYLVVFAAVLSLNACMNYRETGYWILLESYGAIPMYQANNPNTKTTDYSSNQAFEFADEYFQEVYQNQDLDMYQRNKLLKERASEFIRGNLPFVLQNASVRYRRFYLKTNWNWNFFIFFLALAFFLRRKRLSLTAVLLLAAAFLVSTAVPAFGLYIFRYSIPCIPFYSLFNGTLYCLAGEATWKRLSCPAEKGEKEETESHK